MLQSNVAVAEGTDMRKTAWCGVACVLALTMLAGTGAATGQTQVAGKAAAAPVDPAEAALRQALQDALWPADIMKLSADYLRQHPRGPWADAARVLYERSRDSVHILGRNDVYLFKPAFQVKSVGPEVRPDIRKAALGDQDAAIRLAYWCKAADKDLAEPLGRYIGWMQYASLLGHDRASYELALYYRQVDQPALSAMYEARAVALGYVLPTALDNVRK
jgi:hypothetical protein